MDSGEDEKYLKIILLDLDNLDSFKEKFTRLSSALIDILRCYPGSKFFTKQGKKELVGDENINEFNDIFIMLNIFRDLNERDERTNGISFQEIKTEKDINQFEYFKEFPKKKDYFFRTLKLHREQFASSNSTTPMTYLYNIQDVLENYFYSRPIIMKKTVDSLRCFYKKPTKSTLFRNI